MIPIAEAQRFIDKIEKEADAEKVRRMQLENEYGKISSFAPGQSQNLIEYQLDLKEELDKIYHLLSGHVLERGKAGGDKWVEPTDDRLKIFSDYGVKQVMNIISFYINRNTLLSNYDNDIITWKMRDFGIELVDLIFMRYEMFFHYPSPEELYEKYLPLVQSKELEISEDELYFKCVQWSREELQSKIRHYPMLCLAVIDSVHSTYLRALGGEERESLRRFMHVSQNASSPQDQLTAKRGFSVWRPSTWGGS